MSESIEPEIQRELTISLLHEPKFVPSVRADQLANASLTPGEIKFILAMNVLEDRQTWTIECLKEINLDQRKLEAELIRRRNWKWITLRALAIVLGSGLVAAACQTLFRLIVP